MGKIAKRVVATLLSAAMVLLGAVVPESLAGALGNLLPSAPTRVYANVTSPNSVTSGDSVTFTWTPENGGSVTAKVDGAEIKSGDTVSGNSVVQFEATANTGYEFTKASDGTNEYKTNSFNVTVSGNNVNVNAEFAAIEYAVTYDGNGASKGTNPEDTKITVNTEDYKTPEANYERDGYVFVGWGTTSQTEAADAIKPGTEKDVSELIALAENKKITLYAVWEKTKIVNESGEGTLDDEETTLELDLIALGVNLDKLNKIVLTFTETSDWFNGAIIVQSDSAGEWESEKTEWSNPEDDKAIKAMKSGDGWTVTYELTPGEKYSSSDNNATLFIQLWWGGTMTISDIEFSEVSETATTYTVTIGGHTNGSIAMTDASGKTIASGDKVASGTVVTIKATPNANYNFTRWNLTGATATSATASTTTFTVDKSNVTVAATFSAKSSSSSNSSGSRSVSSSTSSSSSASATTTTPTTTSDTITVTNADGSKETATVLVRDGDIVLAQETDKDYVIVNTATGKTLDNQMVTLDGQKYGTGKDGVVKMGFYRTPKGTLVYGNPSKKGALERGKIFMVDGKRYCAKASGRIVTNAFYTTAKGSMVYTNSKGQIVTKKVFTATNGNKYYANKSGKIVKGKWVTYKGTKYYCSKKTGKITKTKNV